MQKRSQFTNESMVSSSVYLTSEEAELLRDLSYKFRISKNLIIRTLISHLAKHPEHYLTNVAKSKVI